MGGASFTSVCGDQKPRLDALLLLSRFMCISVYQNRCLGQNRAPDPPELELQSVARCLSVIFAKMSIQALFPVLFCIGD